MKITKQKLKQIIKEELEEAYGGALGPFPGRYDSKKPISIGSKKQKSHHMYRADDELRGLGEHITDLLELIERVVSHLGEMQSRYGEMAHMGSYATMARKALQTLSDKYKLALDELSRSTEKGWYK